HCELNRGQVYFYKENGVTHSFYNPTSIKIPKPAKRAPIAQKVKTTRHSDQPLNSKWWWIGLILKTRFPVVLKEMTWMMTDKVSITKTNPMMTSNISSLAIMATAAIIPPSASEPVSPINIFAGWALKTKKPSKAPTTAIENRVTN